jgi:diguanylate cyclase (GGDEF)-like protein
MGEVNCLKDENSKLKSKLKNLTDAYNSLKQMNNDLIENIFVDESTRMYNSRYLSIRLDEEMKRAKRYNQFLSLVLVSVNSVVEEQNMPLSEEPNILFMRRLGEFIKANLRDTDILSLYDNDVLALILPETSIEGAVCLSERLKDQVLFAFSGNEEVKRQDAASTIEVKRQDAKSTIIDAAMPKKSASVSIGITSYPTDARVIDELINNASHMLECSRDSENNTIYCSIMN